MVYGGARMSAGNRFGDRPTAPGIEVPLERVPELLQTAALVVDGTGAVTAVNTHLAEFLDRDAADLVGRDAHDALHRDRHGLELARAQCPLVEAHLDRRSRSGTAWFLRGNAAVVELEWTTVPCGDPAREEGTLVLLRPYEPRAAEPELAAERGLPLTELERLALLAETTTQLTSTLDTEEMFGRLIRLV